MIHQLPLFLTVLLAAAASGFLAMNLNRERPPPLAVPGSASASLVRTADLEVPAIMVFDHYYGAKNDSWRHLNPFVPPSQRQNDAMVMNRREAAPVSVAKLPTPPTKPKPAEGGRPPVIVDEGPKIPPLVVDVPPLPDVVGLVAGLHTHYLFAIMGGDLLRLQPGDSAGAWTYVGTDGVFADFSGPDSVQQRIPVGLVSSEGGTIARSDGDRKSQEAPKAGPTDGPNKDRGKDDKAKQPDKANLSDLIKDKDRILKEYQKDPKKAMQQALGDPRMQAMFQRYPQLRSMLQSNPEAVIHMLQGQQGQQGRGIKQ